MTPAMSEVGILLIVRPDVLWDTLLPYAQSALGRSVSSSLDAKGLPCFGAAPFACAAAEFARPKTDAVAVLRGDKLALRHVQYTFMLAVPRKNFVDLSSLGLAVTPSDVGDFAIVSARMNEWHQAVVGLMSEPLARNAHCKALGAHLMAFFEREDFGPIWSTHRKEYTDDGLYLLVTK